MNLSFYMESVLNPEGRFKTLNGLFAVMENGQPRMTTGEGRVSFEVMLDGVRHVLCCFLNDDPARDMRLREVSSYTRHIACPHLVPYLWLNEEMLVFDSTGRAVRVDVALQRVPDGERLDRLKVWPEGLAAGLDRLAEWLEANDFSHGNICGRNVWIAADGTPVLTDYTHASRRRSKGDVLALKSLAAPAEAETATAAPVQKYGVIGEMCDGVMRAQDGDEWVYIDKTGSQVIAGRFLSACDFAEGRAVVETATGFGLLDIDGRWVIEPWCDDLDWDCDYNVAIATKDGLSGMYGRGGEALTGMDYELIMGGTEGLFVVREDGLYGFLHRDGTVAIEPQFDDANAFRNGFARVRIAGNYFVINEKGAIVQKSKELV